MTEADAVLMIKAAKPLLKNSVLSKRVELMAKIQPLIDTPTASSAFFSLPFLRRLMAGETLTQAMDGLDADLRVEILECLRESSLPLPDDAIVRGMRTQLDQAFMAALDALRLELQATGGGNAPPELVRQFTVLALERKTLIDRLAKAG